MKAKEEAFLSREFVAAAAELIRRQRELVPLVADCIGLDPFTYWLDRRHLPILARLRLRIASLLGRYVSPSLDDWREDGVTRDGAWAWTFHGLECDISHRVDGRLVRVDFGPGGRLDTFSSYGVLLLVTSTRAPWREFPSLLAHVNRPDGHPASRRSPHLRMYELEDIVRSRGWIGPCDPTLSRTVEALTRPCPGPDNSTMKVLPAAPPPYRPVDSLLCERLMITDRGRAILPRDSFGKQD